ncbi:MAG: YdbL family protein [Desulfobulbaceae bacterium]|nr:YdbL family protein [Desulfobulbaceae bacterium]
MTKIITICITSLLLFCHTAFAMDLQVAKNQGLVGETTTGYLAAVKAPSAEVQALIKDINGKRKAHYLKIAQKNNTPLATIESMAGTTAMKKSKPGHYIKQGGKWQKK